MKPMFYAATFVAAGIVAGAAQAATYNFDLVYDGTGLSYAAGSDATVGTTLNPGDNFTLTVAAAGDSYFSVNTTDSYYYPLTFFVEPAGSRYGDVTTTFSLDGTTVDQDVETNIGQASIHIGTQYYSFTAGMAFDTVVMEYTFNSGPAGTISDHSTTVYPDWVSDLAGDFGFLATPSEDTFFAARSSIDYVDVPMSAVPLPASFPLIAGALAMMGLVFRRRKTGENLAA